MWKYINPCVHRAEHDWDGPCVPGCRDPSDLPCLIHNAQSLHNFDTLQRERERQANAVQSVSMILFTSRSLCIYLLSTWQYQGVKLWLPPLQNYMQNEALCKTVRQCRLQNVTEQKSFVHVCELLSSYWSLFLRWALPSTNRTTSCLYSHKTMP